MPGQGLSKLPDWAQAAAAAGLGIPAQEADAWVLLQKTEFAYTGDGEIRKHQLRLVHILSERGLREGSFAIQGLGGKTCKVKKLKGWNLRPDGEMVRLESDEVFTLGVDSPGAAFSTHFVTSAVLDRVVKGSWVAFESLEIVRMPLGPVNVTDVMEEYPIQQWELSLAKSEGWFTNLKAVRLRLEARHLQPWIAQPTLTPTSLLMRNVPALPKDEALHPRPADTLPMVYLAFLDPNFKSGPSLESWDTYAKWVYQAFLPHFESVEPVPVKGLSALEGLRSLTSWMARARTYKQVHLSPERGWVPETSSEVLRRRYGDCKDLVACLSGGVAGLGLRPYPVLASVQEGYLERDQPVTPYGFNHAISALRLQESLGLRAEVETSQGRFLLMDPTSRLTPLGWLPAAHRGRRVMICTETGALWVEVPPASIEPSRLDLSLRGRAEAEGSLEATLHLREEGDAASLRSYALLRGAKDLRDHLAGLLGLGSEVDFKVLRVSDPLDLQRALEIETRIRHPHALSRTGSEFALEQIGLPGLPILAQKPGRPRQFPLESVSDLEWTFRADLELPPDLRAVCTQRSLETPFRRASWSSRLEGGHFFGEFHQRCRDARFGFEEREEGVRQAKKDRNQLKLLLEEATTFASKP